MKVIVTGAVSHLCPYIPERDLGEIELTFELAGGDAPELHEVRRSLDLLASEVISHEGFTRLIAEKTGADRVVTRWKTAGMDVACDLSRESVRA